jgi:hypothetical protein
MGPGDLLPLAEGGSGALFLLLIFVCMLSVKKIRWGHEYDDLKDRLDKALEANGKLESTIDVLQGSLQSERDQKAQLASNGSLVNQLLTILLGRAQHSDDVPAAATVPVAAAVLPGLAEEGH